MTEPKQVGKYIGNDYGNLMMKTEGAKHYLGVEGCNYEVESWEEIPDYLHDALNRYRDELDEARGGKFTAACVRMQIQNGNLCRVGY